MNEISQGEYIVQEGPGLQALVDQQYRKNLTRRSKRTGQGGRGKPIGVMSLGLQEEGGSRRDGEKLRVLL